MTTTLSDRAREFLSGKRFGVLATLNPAGTPQLTTMWYELQGARIMMNTLAGRQKERNLKRDPRVSLCVSDGYKYITLRGTVELDYDPALSQAGIKALAVRYDGEEAAERQVQERYGKQQRLNIFMTIASVDEHFE